MSPMIIDAVFAYAHFFAIGCLVAVLAMETALLRDGPTASVIERLAKIDLGYGMSAVLILIAGAGRVGMGLKGAAYYMDNPAFWVKMGLFVLVGLASVPPTLQFIAWRKALKKNPNFAPDTAALRRVRMHLKAQWILLALIPLAAVVMARI
jgi:putative membrane protein